MKLKRILCATLSGVLLSVGLSAVTSFGSESDQVAEKIRTEVSGIEETSPGDSPSILKGFEIQLTESRASLKKTITKNYNDTNSIPDSTYYEEYNNADGKWYSGTLTSVSCSLIYNSGTTKIYEATFSGTIKS